MEGFQNNVVFLSFILLCILEEVVLVEKSIQVVL